MAPRSIKPPKPPRGPVGKLPNMANFGTNAKPKTKFPK